jgi:serine/threonine-protein phosphatase 2A catalytic subunit
MGDYVDRGSQSVEIVSYLFTLMIRYQDSIRLPRGSHESAFTSQHFGFREEVIARYGSDHIWQIYTQPFSTIPLEALIAKKIICVHGWISHAIKTIADIQTIDRFHEIPHQGPMRDLMWSDTATIQGFQP